MNAEERSMIEGLFDRLKQAEVQAGPRDGEAEALIHNAIARQPAAPYLMAQVILVQEMGLTQLQSRVEELERELAQRPQGSGFMGGLFGSVGARPQPAAAAGFGRSRFPGHQPAMQPGQGGGFMAGALQTAVGVAGGMLLANAVAGMFGGEAQAGEAPAEPQETDEGGGFFGGADEDDGE